MNSNRLATAAAVLVATVALAPAAENLRLNPHLDYSSDSHDGPLITGGHLGEGTVEGKPSYVIFYGEG
ncbi:MAG: hypothetical protein LAO07_08420 [Acidobacteriia bacterium]|nr:hypothetical protein [Terriglobia bacterium]